ncbi:hypothetical protein [Terricaulis sp.]|uniref:hypothetical protein n=1 Tax=Terricaulis sp. TaxID=2768686 RepID=UPI003783CC46
MALLRFHDGQRVLVTQAGRDAMAGSFRIVRALPSDAGPQQYRIKSDAEAFERVTDESRLLEAEAL